MVQADLVIEAVRRRSSQAQDLRGTRAEDERGAILATNTSSLRLEELPKRTDAAARFAGLHFFNPVSQDATRRGGRARRDQTGRRSTAAPPSSARSTSCPSRCREYPGFPREPCADALSPRSDRDDRRRHAERRHRWGGRGFRHADGAGRTGRPGRPRHLPACRRRPADGLDRPMPKSPAGCARRSKRARSAESPARVSTNGKDGRPRRKTDEAAPAEDCSDRLILPMLNACVACLREGVVDGCRQIDGAMIFGTGFAPFRGGPMHYADPRRRRTSSRAERTGGTARRAFQAGRGLVAPILRGRTVMREQLARNADGQ